MPQPVYRLSLRRTIASKQSKHTVNMMAYTVGITGNFAAVPQIIEAWRSKAPGLSVTTWFLYTIIGLIWLVYAIQHRQGPLIVAQTVCISANLAVVTGWAVNHWLR